MGEAAKFDFKNVAKALAEKEENTSTKKADDSSDLANAAKYGLAAALVARDKELPMPTSKPLAEMSSEEREKEKDRFRFYMDHFGPKNFK